MKRIRWHSAPKGRFLFWSAVVALLLLCALLGPLLGPHDPYLVDLSQVNRPPTGEYLMGTDYLGRYVFSRLLTGASRSAFAAILVFAMTFIAGTAVGVLSGYFGGDVDSVLMRITDAVLTFPSLVFTVAVAGMLGGGMRNCVIAMTVMGWPA
ncbi:putative D,D-dipeptide transport system permease protein DdpC [bioreactor metagenome]|uniref:Putative D,D-dipeptide transport system permease protein DdpC n=1 Tax=bioreactor metagenome TaxID=1076179 RepID=A0A645A458_9ZZZZ